MKRNLIVRDDNGGRGIDWRAVAAMGALILGLGTITSTLLAERTRILDEVSLQRIMRAEWESHKHNDGTLKHLTDKEYAARNRVLYRIDYRLSRIEERLGIKGDYIPDGRFGADVMPPGEDD